MLTLSVVCRQGVRLHTRVGPFGIKELGTVAGEAIQTHAGATVRGLHTPS